MAGSVRAAQIFVFDFFVFCFASLAVVARVPWFPGRLRGGVYPVLHPHFSVVALPRLDVRYS